MSGTTPPDPTSPDPGERPAERFEVTIEPDATLSARDRTARISELDLDRLPDRSAVRLLVDAEQLERLRAQGLQVRVDRPVPVRPLDPDLIADDESVADWVTRRLPPAGDAGEGR